MMSVCVYWVESHSEKIGSKGVIVEIDEAKIGKHKYNRGRLIDDKWIFGGFSKETLDEYLLYLYLKGQKKL